MEDGSFPALRIREPQLRPERAVALAQELLAAAKANQIDSERDQSQKIVRMMDDPRGKALTIAPLSPLITGGPCAQRRRD